jgi:glycosyltransferase involved in cell wall biosynthesis
LKKRNILILTYWDFNSALVQTYTLPYVLQIKEQLSPGSQIYIMTLSDKLSMRRIQTANSIQKLREKNIHVLNFGYQPFGISMILRLICIVSYLVYFSVKRKINTIHAWCTPAGAIGYLLALLTGKQLVVDSFEPHAETMVEGKTWKKNSLAYRLLFALEKLQLRRAKEVICATEGMIDHSQRLYGIKKKRYFVKPACVDLSLFDFEKFATTYMVDLPLKEKVCIYAGKFGGIYLEKEVFDFFKVAYDYWNGNFTALLLSNHSDGEIKNYCEASGLPTSAVIKKFIDHNDVPAYMAVSHFGICPVKPLPSKQYCTPIKNGEYWAMGLPVVITKDISDDSRIIEENGAGYVLTKLDQSEYLNAVKKIEVLLRDNGLKYKIRNIAEKNRNFIISESVYQTIYG